MVNIYKFFWVLSLTTAALSVNRGFLPEGAEATSIRSIDVNGLKIAGREYYNVSGARISQPQKGVTIVKNIMSDGSIKTTKIYVK